MTVFSVNDEMERLLRFGNDEVTVYFSIDRLDESATQSEKDRYTSDTHTQKYDLLWYASWCSAVFCGPNSHADQVGCHEFTVSY